MTEGHQQTRLKDTSFKTTRLSQVAAAMQCDIAGMGHSAPWVVLEQLQDAQHAVVDVAEACSPSSQPFSQAARCGSPARDGQQQWVAGRLYCQRATGGGEQQREPASQPPTRGLCLFGVVQPPRPVDGDVGMPVVQLVCPICSTHTHIAAAVPARQGSP